MRVIPALLSALLAACDPAERCAGTIEVTCDADGCYCAIGEYEGEVVEVTVHHGGDRASYLEVTDPTRAGSTATPSTCW